MDITVASRDIHLAAYMKANGAELKSVSVVKRIFTFNTTVTMDEWRVLHSNSCCRKVDNELLSLKGMLFKPSSS